jgi:Domain of unknown function (DUF5060)
MIDTKSAAHVEQWGIFELQLSASTRGNPYLDVVFSAQFVYKHRLVEVDGFYDGDGVYRIRFMPDVQGTWRYHTQSTLDFSYADGTSYKPIGTTCYAWTHQGDALEEQTRASLRSAPFNKLRRCVFPKHYLFNENEPPLYPFPCLSRGSSSWDFDQFVRGEASRGWSFDFERFDPAFFRHFERRVADLDWQDEWRIEDYDRLGALGADQAGQRKGDQDDKPVGGVDPERLNLRKDQDVLDQRQQDDAGEGTNHPPAAAIEGDPPNDGSRKD